MRPSQSEIEKMKIFLRLIKNKVGAKNVFAGYLPDKLQPMWKIIVDTDKTIMLDSEFSDFFQKMRRNFVSMNTATMYYASTVAIFSVSNGMKDKRFTKKLIV